MPKNPNRYLQAIEFIFNKYYKDGDTEVSFIRADFEAACQQLGIATPKNIGDVIYSFRYRTALPKSIIKKAPEGLEWIIRGSGRAQYRFVLVREARFIPNPDYIKTKIPDSTPGIVLKYSQDDEQALLAKIRYNRLIDIFTGVTCYSLQNHLRTTVQSMGQIETDEIYIGVDKRGAHYVFPIQAKGGTDKIGSTQIEQDFLVCSEKFAGLIGRPIAAQFMDDKTIVLFEFAETDQGIKVSSEKHYLLVPPDSISDEELQNYRQLTS